MATPSTDTSIAELVRERPGRARIFEQLGIDYGCGGDQSLAEDAELDEDGIEKMIREHDDSGAALERLRDLTNGYTPPEGACPKFRAAMDDLHELEKDVHQHVHKENNILFPRARSLA